MGGHLRWSSVTWLQYHRLAVFRSELSIWLAVSVAYPMHEQSLMRERCSQRTRRERLHRAVAYRDGNGNGIGRDELPSCGVLFIHPSICLSACLSNGTVDGGLGEQKAT